MTADSAAAAGTNFAGTNAPGTVAVGTMVLGLGNLVQADDGVGVHAIERLLNDSRVPAGVELLDGGTQGLALLARISGLRRLLIMDAVDVGQEPGTLIRVEGTALERLPGKPSVHQLGFADLMVALRLLGGAPEEMIVLGIQPLSTEWSAELTPPIEQALDKLTAAVIEQLEAWESSSASA